MFCAPQHQKKNPRLYTLIHYLDQEIKQNVKLLKEDLEPGKPHDCTIPTDPVELDVSALMLDQVQVCQPIQNERTMAEMTA